MTAGTSAANSLPILLRGIGIATFMLLPAWGALFSLRATEMPWVGLADLTLTSLTVAILLYWVTRLKGKMQLFVVAPFVVLFILIGYDALIYIYDSLKAELRLIGILENYKDILRLILWLSILASPILIWLFRTRILAASKATSTLFGILFIVLVAQFISAKGFATSNNNQSAKNSFAKTVVIIFDELDSDLLDAKIDQYPAFNYLEQSAALSGRVYPPSNYTHISVPSMLLGKPLIGSELIGKSILVTRKDDSRNERLPSKDDLLSIAVENGSMVSLVGWHLPYCATFTTISRCIDDAQFGVPGNHLSTIEWLYGKNSLLLRYRENRTKEKFNDVNVYSEAFFKDPRNFKLNNITDILGTLKARLNEDVASRDYDLIFAHLPCPHLPRLDGQLTQGMINDYYDNLHQCDKILDTVINALRKSEDQPWRLIVTADHWFRPGDWIRNKKPGDYPQIPRKVPFYLLANDYKAATIRISGGTNLRLPQILTALKTPNLDVENISSEIYKYDHETVFLDKF